MTKVIIKSKGMKLKPGSAAKGKRVKRVVTATTKRKK